MEAINTRSMEYYEGHAMSSEELLRIRPTSASIAQSIEWIQYICNVHRKELLEKKNILDRINYNNSDGISFLYGQWARPIHLDTSISTFQLPSNLSIIIHLNYETLTSDIVESCTVADFITRGRGVEPN